MNLFKNKISFSIYLKLKALILAFIVLGLALIIGLTDIFFGIVTMIGVLIIFTLILSKEKGDGSIKTSLKTAVWIAVLVEIFLQGAFLFILIRFMVLNLQLSSLGEKGLDLPSGIESLFFPIYAFAVGFLSYFSKRILHSRHPVYIYLFLLIFLPIIVLVIGTHFADLAYIYRDFPSDIATSLGWFFFYPPTGISLAITVASMLYFCYKKKTKREKQN